MRKLVRMTFQKGEVCRGYKGHYGMNYFVCDVIDLSTHRVICKEYIFKNSTIFKRKGFKPGDVIEMSINVDENKEKNSVKLSYYRDIRKITDD